MKTINFGIRIILVTIYEMFHLKTDIFFNFGIHCCCLTIVMNNVMSQNYIFFQY
jgi:hypothetical protein